MTVTVKSSDGRVNLWCPPFIAAAIASAMPVLPLVASIRVAPGVSLPCCSASEIMLTAGLQAPWFDVQSVQMGTCHESDFASAL